MMRTDSNFKFIDHERVVTVSANVNEDMIPSTVVRKQAEKFFKDIDLPDGYKLNITGQQDEQEDSTISLHHRV